MYSFIQTFTPGIQVSGNCFRTHPDELTLTNYSTRETTCDKLHSSEKVFKNQCTDKICKGSMMALPGLASDERSTEELLRMAKSFIEEFYANSNKVDSSEHAVRWEEILQEVTTTGTYELTFPELEFGAKLSWRNASRCIGRIQWNKLKVFDARKVDTTREMFDAICEHIAYGTNEGNIRSAVTVFPPRRPYQRDFRLWNPQLVSYAGYRNLDGSVIGDPGNVEFTKVCMRLGWMGRRTKWDILPLVLSSGGASPDVFDIPEDIVLQVPLTHPSFWWFATLGLRWYALPAVSGMLFDCGGIQFPACPFNGWYMSTEVGCRDLCDPQRYNVLETVAAEMGEDTGNEATLWKDRALVEVNVAVLYSYQQQGVTIVDHHTASDNFIQHLENEQKARKGCPADWVWIVPPMSSSLTSVFHQEMAMYNVKPSYDYQVPAWRTHPWAETPGIPCRFNFKQVASVVQLCTRMYQRIVHRRTAVTILYATETGKSQIFANKLTTIFAHGFTPKVVCMDDYDVNDLRKEALVLIVTSTFGNGDGPENGLKFERRLVSLKRKSTKLAGNKFSSINNYGITLECQERMECENLTVLNGLRYAVFALGSSAYPNFCAFGHTVDQLLNQLGAGRLMEVAEGDELSGQQKSFRKWFSEIYQVCCSTFNIPVDQSVLQSEETVFETRLTDKTVRFVSARGELLEALLSRAFKRNVKACTVLRRTNLHKATEHSSTILVELASEDRYFPGDHVGVLPENRAELVDGLLRRLDSNLDPNEVVKLQLLSEKTNAIGITQTWSPHGALPACTLRTLLTRFLDITSPLRPAQLDALQPLATLPEHAQRLAQLATDPKEYEAWRSRRIPTVLEVLLEFPSVKISPALLATILDPLQPRFYSISSSRDAHPGQIHLTVSVVSFRSEGGAGPVHYGVCSNYLNDVAVDKPVYLFVRNGKNFALPQDVSAPVLMVGPGTGVAPFRGFWEQRRHQIKMADTEKEREEFGEMTLYFGCRGHDMDLFHDEKMEMVKEGVLTGVFVALSREPFVPKTYVQHILEQRGAAVYRSLTDLRGHLFVCGDVSMAEGVRKSLAAIAKKHGFLDDDAANRFIEKLKEGKRYHEDIFGVTQHGPPQKEAPDVDPNATVGRKKGQGTIARVLFFSGGKGEMEQTCQPAYRRLDFDSIRFD